MNRNGLAEGIKICEARDLTNDRKSLLRIWGPPILLIVIGSIGGSIGLWQEAITGVLWTAGIFWFGFQCLRNGLHCGRIHCLLLGIFYPIMGLLILGMTFALVNLNQNIFWIIFIVGTALSFGPEFLGKKYFGVKSS